MVTENEVDDAVEFWHDEYTGEFTLHEFICDMFGWTEDQYDIWARTARLPE